LGSCQVKTGPGLTNDLAFYQQKLFAGLQSNVSISKVQRNENHFWPTLWASRNYDVIA